MQEQPKIIKAVKEYVSDPRHRITLDDLVTGEICKVLDLTTDEHFPGGSGRFSVEEFAMRLQKYESIIKDLLSMTVLLSYWGSNEYLPVLRKIIARVAEYERGSGIASWFDLRGYPSLLVLYAAGIAAIASRQYQNLAALLTTPTWSEHRYYRSEPVIISFADTAGSLADVFKQLPGYERQYVPQSEYLCKILQPYLEELLFLGKSYEAMFDQFEVYFSLIYTDLKIRENDFVCGPLGRFSWKQRSIGSSTRPLVEVFEEATSQGKDWLPLKAGLFGGSIERFQKVAQQYSEFLRKLTVW